MKLEDVKIGMKVVPHQKTTGDLSSVDWNAFIKESEYELVNPCWVDSFTGHVIWLRTKERSAAAWAFLSEDFTLYEETVGKEPVWQKTTCGKKHFVGWQSKHILPSELMLQETVEHTKDSLAAAYKIPKELLFASPDELTVKTFKNDRPAKLADRFNDGKLQWSLVDFKALEPMVQVLMAGAKKYSADNWKLGLNYKALFDSLQRHLVAFMSGEDLDLETGLSHVGHAMCNLMFLSWMQQNKPEMDNRSK